MPVFERLNGRLGVRGWGVGRLNNVAAPERGRDRRGRVDGGSRAWAWACQTGCSLGWRAENSVDGVEKLDAKETRSKAQGGTKRASAAGECYLAGCNAHDLIPV